MRNLKAKFDKEARSFDLIVKKRNENKQIPDIRKDFKNEYFYNNLWRSSEFLRCEYGESRDWIVDSFKRANAHSVVELGSGNGWLSLELAREGFRVTGIDISSVSIKTAKNYLNKLREKNKLSLRYIRSNVIKYPEYYTGESVVCFGFLHHLPPQVLKKTVYNLSKNMNRGEMFIAVEPRYDHANYEIAILIYALRLALPNHFKYKNCINDFKNHINDILKDLTAFKEIQSEMDNASPSDLIIKTMKDNFKHVDLRYSTAFFEKIIASIRVSDEDTHILVRLLKQFDDMVVKYNSKFSRKVMIKAWNDKY